MNETVHPTVVESSPPPTSVRVVALGASAGGLAALRTFFEALPPTQGVAYVVVQHLDPTHSTMLATLLQRSTAMTVSDMGDGDPIRANHVYVVPPGCVAHLESGRLHLADRSPTGAGHAPIDHFLRSLAAAKGAEGVGVVLSGTGSDGTLGLAALQSAGALTMAQRPDSAEFSGMPHSAVAAGVVDVVADVDDLARTLATRLQKPVGDITDAWGALELSDLVALVKEGTGKDFSGYKPATLWRRLTRRMALHQMASAVDYVRLLRDDPTEVERLARDFVIGVTSFFRDQSVWRALATDVLPAMVEGRDPQAALRAWVVGCSTGEEAYSLAMTYVEAVERRGVDGATRVPSLRIFATDVEATAIDRARQGLYSPDVVADVGEERFSRFFTPVGGQVRIAQRIRNMVVFAVHDILNDPPFTRLDLVTCRNLLIYLEPPMQQQLLTTLHHSLDIDGVLVLGLAEGTGEASPLFRPISEGQRIFRPVPSQGARTPVAFSAVPSAARQLPRPTGGETRQESQFLRTLVQQYAPPSVLTDEQGDLLYVSGSTGGILEAPSGRVNWNLLALVPEHIRWTLGQALRAVVETGEPVELVGLQFDGLDGRSYSDIQLRLLSGAPSDPRRVLVSFGAQASRPTQVPGLPVGSGSDVPDGDASSDEAVRMDQALRAAYAELHAASEQQALLNEEMQTTNEQLQSANEELMVSMEEVQSMNEELQTLNQELQARVDELVTASDDMGNLLDSTEIATVFLDSKMNVRRFTPHATSVISLREVDVGRPVSEITSTLQYPELVVDAVQVMRTAQPRLLDVPTTDGRWFSVRLLPYRTHDDRLDGVVITFSDITAAKTLEAELRAAQESSTDEVADDD